MKIKKILLVITIISLFVVSISLVSSSRNLTSEQALEDAEYLKEMLEKVHPNIYFSTDREIARKKFSIIEEKLKSRKKWPVLDLYRTLAPYVAMFEDGHTFLSINKQFMSFAQNGGRIFPLLVSVKEGRVQLVANLTSDEEPVGGSRILSINGFSSDYIYSRMRKAIGAGRNAFAEAKISNNFPILLWGMLDIREPYDVICEDEKGNQGSLKIPGIPLEKYKKRKDNILGRMELNWDLSFLSNKIALLTINTFSAGLENEFKKFIERSFRKVKSEQIEYLVIDLRNNSGGSTELSDYLYKYVSKKPFRTFAEVRVKYSDPVQEELNIYNPITWVRVNLFGKRIIVHYNDYESPPETDLRFKGNLYVLIGPETFSTAVDFAAIIKDLEAGTIIGEETGGLASTYGDVYRGELPYSNLEFGISYKYFLRTGGFDDGKGALPDIYVQSDLVEIIKGNDNVLDATIDRIRSTQNGK